MTTHNTQKRQTAISPTEFEPAITASNRPQTLSLGRLATGINTDHVNQHELSNHTSYAAQQPRRRYNSDKQQRKPKLSNHISMGLPSIGHTDSNPGRNNTPLPSRNGLRNEKSAICGTCHNKLLRFIPKCTRHYTSDLEISFPLTAYLKIFYITVKLNVRISLECLDFCLHSPTQLHGLHKK